MNKLVYLLLILIVPTAGLHSQESQLDSSLDSLSWYADIMHHASIAQHRLIAEENLATLLYHSLSDDSSFHVKYPEMPGVKFIYEKDSTFRLFTWQLIDSTGRGKFYGIFQKRGDRPVKLNDVTEFIGSPQQGVLGKNKWIGVVYEDIIGYGAPEDSTYILIGSGVVDKTTWKHIAESFKIKDGQPVFGIDAFVKEDEKYDRIVSKFSAGSGALMHYIPEKTLIIFDRLRVVYDPITDVPSYVPSGFYDAYKKDHNSWRFIENSAP